MIAPAYISELATVIALIFLQLVEVNRTALKLILAGVSEASRKIQYASAACFYLMDLFRILFKKVSK